MMTELAGPFLADNFNLNAVSPILETSGCFRTHGSTSNIYYSWKAGKPEGLEANESKGMDSFLSFLYLTGSTGYQ
jgi:hypothetical protein